MKLIKHLFLFVALSLMLSPQMAFAARGVDYQGYGNPITIVDGATGLTIGTGQAIYLANGSTFLTGAGALTLPGSSTLQSLTVNPGNVTVTAGNLILTAGGVTANAGTVHGLAVTGGSVSSTGALSSGNGLLVSSGSTTITAGNLRLDSGHITLAGTSKNVYINNGNLMVGTGSVNVETGNILITTGSFEILMGDATLDQGNLKLLSGYAQVAGPVKIKTIGDAFSQYVDVMSGTATARASVRGLNSNAGDNAKIGSLYLSKAGKMYLKIADNKADADWQLVTTTDAD